jgi:NAD(P)H-hydrate epimerase
MDHLGIPGLVLMENAGRQLADITLMRSTSCDRKSVFVVAGKGNNGGDGFVAARHLGLRGERVVVALVAEARSFDPKSDAGKNLSALRSTDTEIVETSSVAELGAALGRCGPSVLVDAVFGTGLSGPVRGFGAAVLEWMSEGDRTIIAADLPSGLDADSGEALGAVPTCVATATFLAPKLGLQRGLGPERAGEVYVCDIGVPWQAVVEAAEG